MKYQALKRLKTKTKLLKMCDTLQEARGVIEATGAKFREFAYFGGFPTFADDKNTYQIQGSVQLGNGQSVVCSIDKAELSMIK